jgi:Tfp pilus assembly protein PilP
MMTAPQRLLVAATVAAVMASSVAAAQTPATPGQTAAPGQAAAPAKSKPAEPPPVERPAYSYEPEGRRDPFISLLARGSDPASASSRPAGVPGLLINEITVKGIVRDRSGFLAIIQGPDTTKTFIVRNGEPVMDGAVKTITVDTVVFAQDVNDPLSMVKQREVRKAVRPLDDQRGVRE